MNKSAKKKPQKIHARGIASPYKPGKNPENDAWFTAFFIENHLDYYSFPFQAVSPEQIRFMVYTEGDERYYPCTDGMFEAIMSRSESELLKEKYDDVLQRILGLIEEQIENEWEKRYLDALIKIKHRHETRDGLMIPSRLEKRLLGIFVNRTQIDDPFLCKKAARNRRVKEYSVFQSLSECPEHY